MIVGFPIAFYTSGFVALVVYAVARDPFWYRASMSLWFAGVAMAALAAVFGLIDLFGAIPRDESATRRTGTKHFGLNMLAVVLFAAGAFAMLDDWNSWLERDQLPFILPLVIGAVALVLTITAGMLGWKLVQTHHVGVESDAQA